MKKLFNIMLSSILTIVLGFQPVFANEVEQPMIPEQSIQYNSKLNGYELKNVTMEEVLEAFQNDPNTDLIGDPILEKSIVLDDLSAMAANQYRQSFRISRSIAGPKNDSITIYYVLEMNMTTVNYNGTQYAKFVSVSLEPTYSMGTNGYIFDTGTGAVKREILNSGATLQFRQIIQLVSTTTVSLTGGLTAGWYSVSSTTSSSSFVRNHAQVYYTTYNLPLINIIM